MLFRLLVNVCFEETCFLELRGQTKFKYYNGAITIHWFNVLFGRSGLGSYYGTIGGTVPYFNPAGKQVKAALPSGKNVLTNPGKKGTGYG